MKTMPCRECGASFTSRQGQRVCSRQCRSARVERRLAAKFTTAQRDRILHRDRWTCGICTRAIRKELTWPHPESACVDHIVPVSKGGEHSTTNAQAAHLGCNAHKGSRIAPAA